jgi:predicted helicase
MTKPLADFYHLDIYGLRKDKYQTLLDNSISTLPWNKIECRAPEYFFVAKDFGVYGQYVQGFSVSELFPVNSIGIQTHRDDFVVDMDKATLTKRIQTFYDQNYSDREIAAKLNLQESCDWKISEARQKETFNSSKMLDVLYRPFDYRKIYYSSNLIDRGREKIMQHFLKGDNFGLATCRQQSTFDFQHIFVTKNLVDRNMVSLQTKESNYVFPLYLYPETTGQQSLQETSVRQPNLNPAIVQQIAENLGLAFTPEKSTVIPAGMRVSSDRDVNVSNPWTLDSGNPCRNDAAFEHYQSMGIKEELKEYDNPASFAPIDLLDYIYAVLHSPTYRDTYKEFLKTDFPRVPYPDPHTFWPLVKLGGELRQLHLLDSPAVNNPITTYPMDGDNTVTRKINQHDYIDGKVWINDQQYFDSVPKIAWEFYIGGYQPAQ